MNTSEKIKIIFKNLNKKRSNQFIDTYIDWITFLLGQIPDLLVINKPSQIVNKIINDKKLNKNFQKVWAEILTINRRLETLESGLDRIDLIGATVANNTLIQKNLYNLLEELKSSLQSEFDVKTSNWSTQEIINTVISSYSSFKVSSIENSRTSILKTKVYANKTQLIAKDNSHNRIQDSSFHGEQGSVGMDGEHLQSGDVTLSQASIGYGQNSQTQMGSWVMGTSSQDPGSFFIGYRSSPKLTMSCPSCKRSFEVSTEELHGLYFFQCKLCGGVHSL